MSCLRQCTFVPFIQTHTIRIRPGQYIHRCIPCHDQYTCWTSFRRQVQSPKAVGTINKISHYQKMTIFISLIIHPSIYSSGVQKVQAVSTLLILLKFSVAENNLRRLFSSKLLNSGCLLKLKYLKSQRESLFVLTAVRKTTAHDGVPLVRGICALSEPSDFIALNNLCRSFFPSLP